MKPIGYISESGKDRLASRAHWYCLSVSKTKENEFTIPIYDTAPEAVGVRELVEALEAIAGVHMERTGYGQSDCDMVPDLTIHEAQTKARAALANYRGKA